MKEAKKEINECRPICKPKSMSCGGAVYGLGLVGAVVYFVQNATSFTDGLFGIIKAIVWPALVIYKFLEFFKF